MEEALEAVFEDVPERLKELLKRESPETAVQEIVEISHDEKDMISELFGIGSGPEGIHMGGASIRETSEKFNIPEETVLFLLVRAMGQMMRICLAISLQHTKKVEGWQLVRLTGKGK